MYDVALHGHLTIDTIVDDTRETKTLGSMANVWKSLVTLDPSLRVGISPIHIGEALIYVDHDSSRRYSKGALNLKTLRPRIQTAKIHHITYINEIDDLEFIKSLDGIVCADVCAGKPLRGDIINYIDYLFISDEDSNNLNELVKGTKGWVVQHGSTWSWVTDGHVVCEYNLPREKHLSNVNVLGAGDTFASCFLYKLLRGEGDIKDWIEYSHLTTTDIIKNSI